MAVPVFFDVHRVTVKKEKKKKKRKSTQKRKTVLGSRVHGGGSTLAKAGKCSLAVVDVVDREFKREKEGEREKTDNKETWQGWATAATREFDARGSLYVCACVFECTCES